MIESDVNVCRDMSDPKKAAWIAEGVSGGKVSESRTRVYERSRAAIKATRTDASATPISLTHWFLKPGPHHTVGSIPHLGRIS